MSAPLLKPGFKYRASFDTDIRRTFARIRREQKQATASTAAPADAPAAEVLPMAKPARRTA